MESPVPHNVHAANSRHGLLVSREKHKGISFVNTTTARPSNIPRPAISGVKFVPPKSLKPRPPRELVTENDLRRAQGGKNRRIAPKHSRSGHEKEDVPYEFATKGGRSAPFFFELMKAWRQVNDTEHQRHPSPTRFILPNWTLHGLPKDISDEGRMCFHSYLFSCPIRHYPFEQAQITSWQPLSKDQERFQRLMLEPLTLRCTLTMGALFLLLKSGKNESAGFSMHSARLCALVNQLLGDKRQTLDKKIVVIQSVACLALLATFLGLYDHWYAHVNGLKLLIQEVGGFQAVPAPVQLLAKKADLKGASEIVTMPLLPFGRLHPPISSCLPRDQQVAISTSVRRAVSPNRAHEEICNAMIDLATFVAAIDFAESRHGRLFFDPLAVMEEYHSVEYRLLVNSGPIQRHLEALKWWRDPGSACSDIFPPTESTGMVLDVAASLENTLRLAALFYLKLAKGGPADCLDGPVHMLGLMSHFLCRIIRIPRHTDPNSAHGLPRTALLWVCLVADQMARTAESENWNTGGRSIDRRLCRDFLHWVLDGNDISLVSEDDLELCHLLEFRRFEAGRWDPQVHIRRIFRS
ncbi:hypothetical protein ACJZ2D_009241 [Fusarium nematophilum]